MGKCDKCGKKHTEYEPFVRGLHEKWYYVCWTCHVELAEEECNGEESTTANKEAEQKAG